MSAPDVELTVDWQRSVARDTTLLAGLLGRYREPHRRYHTAVHVRWVLRHVDTLAITEPVVHLDEIVAAAFYHDAIYDPRRTDNERVSAELARRDLHSLGWADEHVTRVVATIDATAHTADVERPIDIDTAVLLDADLAVLGTDPAAYSAYAAGVRHEYAHVDDAGWRVGRAAVLETLLAHDSIYVTQTGRDHWESRARANLAAELATLR